MLNLTALKNNKLNTSALGGRKPVGDFISQAPEQSFFQKLASKIPSALKEPFVGTGQTVDLAGRTKFDTGIIGMFRPLGFGKSKEEKASDRIDLLSPLVAQGTITQERMNEIIKDVVKIKGVEAISQGLSVKDLELTRPERIALRPVIIEETLDKIFGALDVVSFGTLKPITRTAAEKIAKSIVSGDIAQLLKKEIPKMSDEANKIFSKALVGIDDANDVQRVINKTELALQKVKETAGKVDTKALTGGIEPRKPVGFGLDKEAIKYKSAEDFISPMKVKDKKKLSYFDDLRPTQKKIAEFVNNKEFKDLEQNKIKKGYFRGQSESEMLKGIFDNPSNTYFVKIGKGEAKNPKATNIFDEFIDVDGVQVGYKTSGKYQKESFTPVSEEFFTEYNKIKSELTDIYNKTKKPTPKPTTTLQQEAKKFIDEGKSADEFIEAQTPIFRGTESMTTRIQGITDEYTGTAFSRNREVAQNYGDRMFVKYLSENEILKARDLPKGTLKELRSELRKLPSILETGDLIETEKLITKVMKIAEQNNKKAADIASIFPSMSEEAEIRLIGGLGDAPTKSQLKDIYNKANKPLGDLTK